METSVKQRLIGAVVLALIAILFLPMLLKPDVKAPDVAEVPLDMPKAPESEFETRDLPLNVPVGKAPEGGVLGVPSAPADSSMEPVVSDDANASAAPIVEVPTGVTTAPAAPANTSAPGVKPAVEIPTPVKPAEVIKSTDIKPADIKPVVGKPLESKPVETKPTPIKPASVAAGNFTITVGSFSKIDSANALVARLKAQKLPVLTEKVVVDGKPAIKIRIGPYADRASAEVARVKADEIAGGSSKVNAQDAAPAAAAGKPTIASKPVAAASSGFSVQLEALSDQAKAEEMRNRARGMGFNAFVKRVDTEKGVLYSVRLGPVADRDAANKLRHEASQKLGKTGIVKSHP